MVSLVTQALVSDRKKSSLDMALFVWPLESSLEGGGNSQELPLEASSHNAFKETGITVPSIIAAVG
jgi:hypothetical protein